MAYEVLICPSGHWPNSLLLNKTQAVKADSLVSFRATLLGTLGSLLAAHARGSLWAGDPQRLQALGGLFEGELHGLALSQAAEALHVQFALSKQGGGRGSGSGRGGGERMGGEEGGEEERRGRGREKERDTLRIEEARTKIGLPSQDETRMRKGTCSWF